MFVHSTPLLFPSNMSTSMTHSQSLRFLLVYASSSDEVLQRQSIQNQSGSVCPFTGKPHYSAGSKGNKKPPPAPATSRITTWSGCTTPLSYLSSSSSSFSSPRPLWCSRTSTSSSSSLLSTSSSSSPPRPVRPSDRVPQPHVRRQRPLRAHELLQHRQGHGQHHQEVRGSQHRHPHLQPVQGAAPSKHDTSVVSRLSPVCSPFPTLICPLHCTDSSS